MIDLDLYLIFCGESWIGNHIVQAFATQILMQPHIENLQ